MSALVLPSPWPSSASSLVPLTKCAASGPTATSHESLADITKSEAISAWYLWFGGQSSTGVAESVSCGGSVSATTVTCTSSVAVPSMPSSTVSVSVWTPGGSSTVGVAPVTGTASEALVHV